MGEIRDTGHQIKEDTISLVNDLEIEGIFKDKDKEEESSIIDLAL